MNTNNRTDTSNRTGDSYARESFTWRRMRGWQLWGITIVCIVLIAGILAYYIQS